MFEKIKKLKREQIAAIAFIFVLLFGLIITIVQVRTKQENRSHASSEAVSVILSPITKTVNVGDQFGIDVNINAGQNDVSAVDITFSYDSNRIHLENGGLGPTSFTIIKNDASIPGTIHFVGVNVSNSHNTGNFRLGSLTFRALSSGNATIGLSNIHINASGVAGALPIDAGNTKIGAYTIKDAPIDHLIPTNFPPKSQVPSNTQTPFPCDINQDGKTTILDYTVFLTCYNKGTQACLKGDLNHDGKINELDLNIFLRACYGKIK